VGERARDQEIADPVRAEMARDAYQSATLVGLLTFLWGAISLVFVPRHPFWAPNALQAVLGAAGLAWFVRTRRRPRTRHAVIFSAVIILYAALLLPWTATAWTALGRPFEAFSVPHVALVSMALVVPRYFWLGLALLGLFAADAAFAYAWPRHTGAAALQPQIEPYSSLAFALLGVGLLVQRERRRRIARRHVRVQAEIAALLRVRPLFVQVHDELARRIAALSKQLAPLLQGDGPRSSRRIRTTVNRLAAVDAKVATLVEHEATRAAAPRVPSPARQLLARDAHFGAIIFCGLIIAWTLLVTRMQQPRVGQLLALAAGGVALALLVVLLRRARRPSQRAAHRAVLLALASVLPGLSFNQLSLTSFHHPYELFTGHKIFMVGLGLVLASSLWLGIALIVLLALHALAFYFALHLGAHRELFSLAEPWVTLVFMLVAIASLLAREQRRLASVKLLHAQAESSALQRRARLLLALRDQLNSPLQVLVLDLNLLGQAHPGEDLAPIRHELDQLVALSRQLATVENLVPTEALSPHLEAD
jgi:hypothetical protein